MKIRRGRRKVKNENPRRRKKVQLQAHSRGAEANPGGFDQMSEFVSGAVHSSCFSADRTEAVVAIQGVLTRGRGVKPDCRPSLGNH